TREFLAVAGTSPLVAGVVGWVDLTDPGVPAAIDALRAAEGGSRLVGIRHQVHDEPDPDWLSRPDVRRGIRAVADAGLVFDLLLRPRELPAGLAVARAFPDTRFVVDHLAKPPVATHEIEPWASLLRPFGELENVSAKVSGLVTEADWRSWETQDLRRYVDHALEVFGPQRLLFGSDWPVCLLAASYDRVVAAARSVLAELSAGERDAVFGSNARSVYRLPAQV
ncbi:MAG: amidohydrolase family protein, partial [Chloroflexota bacterium]